MVGEGEMFLGVRKEWLAAIDWWSSGIFIGISQFLIGWPLLGFILQTSRSLPVGENVLFYGYVLLFPVFGTVYTGCLFYFLNASTVSQLIWLASPHVGMLVVGILPYPWNLPSMFGFVAVVTGLYPGVLLYQLLELRRRSRMSSDELEVFLAELEVREVEAQEREDKISAIYVSFFFLLMVVVVDFMSVGIPTIHWKWYDPLPMFWQALILSVVGMAVSVLVKRLLGWKVSGWVYGVLLMVSVLGVLLVWGYPVVLLVAPWWVAYGIGSDWVALVEETAHSTLKSLRLYTQK
ncbi:parapinopsin [Rothia aeria]|uniref:parapinopsin n=1 Tax=Rothia aeria TaxID=172042 RepID=UPI00244965D3|nr:parapinopsin [Rothia aeria]